MVMMVMIPIDVTLVGIVIDVNDMQYWKAEAADDKGLGLVVRVMMMMIISSSSSSNGCRDDTNGSNSSSDSNNRATATDTSR